MKKGYVVISNHVIVALCLTAIGLYSIHRGYDSMLLFLISSIIGFLFGFPIGRYTKLLGKKWLR